MSLFISLRSETLKLKRTLSIYICLIAAGIGPLLSMLEYFSESDSSPKGRPWSAHFMEGSEPLSLAMLPLYIILVSTLLLQLEYRDKTWKQVLSSPQRKIDIFLAKFHTLQIMIIGFLLAYNFFTLITAIITEQTHPELYNGGFDVYRVLKVSAQTYVLNFGMSAIQFWLALRFRNFIVSLGIGFGLWFMAPMLAFEFKSTLIEYYPYAFTMLGVLKPYSDNTVPYQLYSLLTALIFLIIAFVDFKMKKATT